MSTLFIKDRDGNSIQTVTEFKGEMREIAERLSGYKTGTYKIFNQMGGKEYVAAVVNHPVDDTTAVSINEIGTNKPHILIRDGEEFNHLS